jgi:hypothetical protein
MRNPRPVTATMATCACGAPNTQRMHSLYFLMGYNAAERGLSPRDRFLAETHNEQFRWGYFTRVAETEEIIPSHTSR